jgi:Glycosyltransferase family 28 C-terminal domain
VPDSVVGLRATYPMSRYFAAFDASVAAAGYNAYHELIELGVPSLFVPMQRDTDDQPARARYAEASGLGLGLTGASDPQLEAKLDRLLAERAEVAGRLAARTPSHGAGEAARWLAELRVSGSEATGKPQSSSPRGGAREFRRRWGSFFASLPQTAYRLTTQQLTKPRARAHVIAVGLSADQVVGAVEAAIAEAGEPPERTLVITDALASLGDLRALGVGVEHVPARGSRQAELAGVPYEEFLARRLDLIRAERPRPRRVIVAPGGAPVP